MRNFLMVLTLALALASPALAQTPSPNHNDSAVLGADLTFENRVQAATAAACIAIANEGFTVLWHKQRANLCAQILFQPAVWKPLFASTVATDANVLADATQAGTVPLTTGNVTAQGAKVTDAHMDAAISAEFNTFLVLP